MNDLIRKENERPGTRDWQLTYYRVDSNTGWRSPSIEGYVSRLSLRAGERLDLCVSADPPGPFACDLYRLGYYGGDGGRFLRRLGPFKAQPQPVTFAGESSIPQCDWTPCASMTVPEEWVSGVYLGKLTRLDTNAQSYVVFIVRDDRPADLLLQCSDFTWQAYNRWPVSNSLYDFGDQTWYTGGGTFASCDRPYGKYCQHLDAPLSLGSGEFLLWEFPLAFWLERHGYDVSYISNLDTHLDGGGLRRAKGFLSVGHDEYWTREMFENMKSAIAEGLSAAFLSGNSIGFPVNLHPSATSGVPCRVLERLPGWERTMPESAAAVMGARNVSPVTGVGDWTVRRAGHWMFEGTGMRDGDAIPGLVGWEYHDGPGDQPGLEVLAEGKTIDHKLAEGRYTATIYPGPQGNWVFNAATIWWSQGLSSPPGHIPAKAFGGHTQGPDPRVQRITANFLSRIGAQPPIGR